MKKPAISVIMSIYSEPVEWLDMAIESILNQTYRDFEFIIVNDNPSRVENKKVLELIAKKDTRVKVISNKENIGLTRSLNVALRKCHGEYIARMDADDISLPSRFKQQISFLESHPNVDVLSSYVLSFMEDDRTHTKLMKYPVSNNQIQELLAFGNPVAHPTVFLRKSSLNRYGLEYNESVRKSQDYGLWLDFALRGAIFYTLPIPLLMYRRSSTQTSTMYVDKQNVDRNHLYRKFVLERLSSLGISTTKLNRMVLLRVKEKMSKDERPFDRNLLFRLYFSYCPMSYTSMFRVIRDSVKLNFTIKQCMTIILSLFSTRWDCHKCKI